MTETPAQRARRIADAPELASDSDKLESIADLIDLIDGRLGFTGREIQIYLCDLAERLRQNSNLKS